MVFSGRRLAVLGKRRVDMAVFALLVTLFVFTLLADSAWAQDPLPTTITVTKSDNPDPVRVGDTLQYQIVVLNTGTEDAEDVQLVDVLPANTTFVSVTTNQGDCDELTVGATTGTITCELGDIVAPGGGVTVTLRVRPTATAGEVGSVSNTATAQGENTNTAADTEVTQVEPSDITITKDDSPDPADVGEALIYTLEVTNNSGSTRDLVIVDELPDEVDFIAVEPSDRCEETSGVVTCEFNNVPATETRTVIIAVEPQKAGTIENKAQVFFANDLFTPIAQTTETTRVEGDGDDDGDDDGDIKVICSQIIGDIDTGEDGITNIEGNRFCTTVINNFGDDDDDDGGGGGGGGDDDDNGDDNDGDDDNDNNGDDDNDDDDNIATADKPDGDVLDTSALDELPNTGGPSSSGGALIAGLALLGGAGLSLWKFGGRRGRSGD